MEEWRTIAEYPNYQASSYGRIRNASTKEVLCWRANTSRHTTPRVVLRKNNMGKTVRVSKMIAETFLEKPAPDMHLRFRDNNPNNTSLMNLYYDSEPHVSFEGKKVRVVEYGHVFESVSEAAKSLEVSRPAIRYALKMKHRTVSGLHLEWAEEKEMANV